MRKTVFAIFIIVVVIILLLQQFCFAKIEILPPRLSEYYNAIYLPDYYFNPQPLISQKTIQFSYKTICEIVQKYNIQQDVYILSNRMSGNVNSYCVIDGN